MMNQMIVLKVEMADNEKSRKKAMKIASVSKGVTSVSVQGQNSDQLVVLGVEIDTAELTRELRKKVGKTSIITVQAARPQPQQQHHQQHQGQYYEVRRCTCEILHSGYCGFCRSMNQNYYNQVVAPSYHSPVVYDHYRDDGGCNIM